MDDNNVSNTKAASIYWLGSMGQMVIVCAFAYILKRNDILYPQILNTVFLIVGGMSSAFWGIIISLKFKRKKNLYEIFKDFFDFRKSPFGYLVVIGFILIIFGIQLFQGKVNEGVHWYTYGILFLQAIVFGGIEEIGWRYTWQPIIEKRCSFIVSCVATFASWLLWHYMYFYITDSISMIDHLSFIIGLVGSSFILGAIFRISKSLWLCVVYHCLLNVFSQTLLPANLTTTIICNVIAIAIAILISKLDAKRNPS